MNLTIATVITDLSMKYSRSHPPIDEPDTYGRYKVNCLLGEGAMGRVYLAEDPVLDRQVAIKVIAVEKQSDGRSREEYLKRFNLEARASAKLSHPSIVTIFDAGDQNGLPWIAFEYVKGEQLEEILKKPKLLPLSKIVAITLDIASALHHAHEHGIIHRDVKPANILIDKRTHIAKLADFGVVKAPWVALTQDGSAVGSPGYMAPEQLDGTGTDARCDLFSLGIVLYQMLTGKHPFLRESIPATIYATVHGTCTPVNELRGDTPRYLADITAKLLESDREKRIQTAAQLLRKLRAGNTAEDSSRSPGLKKDAFLGNTTRLKRISSTLQALGKKGFLRMTRSRPLKILFRTINRHRVEIKNHAADFFERMAVLGDYRKQLFTAIPLIVSLILFLAVLFPRYLTLTTEERSVISALKKEGYTGKPFQLLDTCNSLADRGFLDESKKLASRLVRLRRIATRATLLSARIALLDGDDSTASAALIAASAKKDWQKAFNEDAAPLLRDCAVRLTRKSVDSTLVSTLAETLFRDRNDTLQIWMGNVAYWLRWNSVRVARHLDFPVDTVAVYILDLKHAGSVRTRRHAAIRLGELGDRRAVAPLKAAVGLGFRDPIVAGTARMVLKNYFSSDDE